MNAKAVATQMKVTCRPSVLGQALQVVSRAISSRTTLPILNNILIETTSEGLALTATNLEIGIRKVVPAEVAMEGSTTAPARLLTDFVSTLPDQDLELTLDGATQSLGLKCARFDTHIKCIEAEEFPPGPRPDEGDRLEVPLDELIKAIEQTQMAASTDEARPVLTGVLVQIQAGNLTLAATDGHRLAVRKLPAQGAGDLEASLIVPARALAELARVLKGEPGRVELIISKARNQIFFKAGNSELTSRLIDGKYPNYAQVIPSKSSTAVRVATAELTQTVRAVSLFARDSANVIRVKAQQGAVVLSATTNEVGDSRAEMPADVEGSEIQIAFNARYVLDALGVIGEDEVELLFDGPLSPGLLRPPGKEHYLYVIMPVRVAMS
ncbi:MAG TPA: DNA polymerase III subunit beta [Candidatus Dormibacteraeota bacterium]|nr:DNA polymerase III subunit beta [Candidatus Dormibacteraeota bacterium]